MKLALEKEFKTVFLGITKKTQVVAFSLFAGIAFVVDIAQWVMDHLLWNHVYHVLEGFFQSIDN